MENKKRCSSDELNETDNLIKKYKVDIQKLNIMKLILQKRNLISSCWFLTYYLKQMKKKDSGEATDAEDGIPDILMPVTTKLLELLQQNIDSLNIPIF